MMMYKPLPKGQQWLLDRMKSLGYRIDEEGMCFGIMIMIMQALHTNNLNLFYKRLAFIRSIPVKKFRTTIEDYENKRVELIKKIKDEYLVKYDTDEEYRIDQQNKFLNDSEIITKIETRKEMIAKLNIDEQAKDIELQKHQADFIRNAFIQSKIDEAWSKLPEEERFALEIPALFEGIAINQDIREYKYLLSESENVRPLDLDLSLAITASKRMIEQGWIKLPIEGILGIYDIDKLTKYFDCIQKCCKVPTTLLLYSNSHALEVHYDPNNKFHWLLMEANKLEYINHWLSKGFSDKNILNSKEMAKIVMKSLTENDNAIFTTILYTTDSIAKTNPQKLEDSIEALKKNHVWKRIHTLLPDEVNKHDSDQASILHIASMIGDEKKVESLVKAGAKIEYADEDGYTPLTNAVEHNRIEVMKFLLSKKANMNVKDKNGFNLLHMATYKNYLDIVKLILEANIIDVNETVQTATAVFLAAQFGYEKIMRLLLEKENINVEEKYTCTKENIIKLGQTFNVEEKINEFISQKRFIDSESISISPLEIAEILGHTTVANLIKEKIQQQNTKSNINNSNKIGGTRP